MIRPYVCYLQTDWDQNFNQLEVAYNNPGRTSTGKTLFLVINGQHLNTMNDVIFRAPPDGEDPPAVQDSPDATERARTLAREAIEQMKSRMAVHFNAHRRDVQFQIADFGLLSSQNLRFPVGTTCAKKFASRLISPFSVVDRIADYSAYRLDLPSHVYLLFFFSISSLKPSVDGSYTRPTPS
jgi:hypothetical protein